MLVSVSAATIALPFSNVFRVLLHLLRQAPAFGPRQSFELLLHIFCRQPFGRTKKHPKIKLAKIHQHLKNVTLDAPGFNFDNLFMPVGLPFLISVRERLNLLNCNKYNAKPFVNHFRPAILATKINKQIRFFQTPFLDIIFLILS